MSIGCGETEETETRSDLALRDYWIEGRSTLQIRCALVLSAYDDARGAGASHGKVIARLEIANRVRSGAMADRSTLRSRVESRAPPNR